MDRPRFERCWCTGVDRERVVAAIRAGALKTFDQVRRGSGACYGCQSCRPELEALIEEVWTCAEQETSRIQRPEVSGGSASDPSSSPPSSSSSSSSPPTPA